MKSNRYTKAVQEFYTFISESVQVTEKYFSKIKPELYKYLEKNKQE